MSAVKTAKRTTDPELLFISRTLRALSEMPYNARIRALDYIVSAVHDAARDLIAPPPGGDDLFAPKE